MCLTLNSFGFTINSRIRHHGALTNNLKKKILKTRDDITLKILGGCSGKTLSTTPAYYTRLNGTLVFLQNISIVRCIENAVSSIWLPICVHSSTSKNFFFRKFTDFSVRFVRTTFGTFWSSFLTMSVKTYVGKASPYVSIIKITNILVLIRKRDVHMGT